MNYAIVNDDHDMDNSNHHPDEFI